MRKMIKNSALVSLAFFLLASMYVSCQKDDTTNDDTTPNTENSFEGNVIIVGAGASGLAAAKKMEEEGISYQILEATEHYGGRIQKNEEFADFPIDLGAEWIHADKSILHELIDKTESDLDIETVLYQPLDYYEFDGTNYEQISVVDMQAFYTQYITEYKFKNTTWYDYISENFAQEVEQNIIYNSKVTNIDYSGEQVVLNTENGMEYTADKVILTVSLGVLKSNSITFIPALPTQKVNAIESVEFLPGFKLFMKFSEKFYPDVITCQTQNGGRDYYDIAYHKEAEDHVLGLLSVGVSAEEYYQLGSWQAIVDAVLEELDGIFDGAASQYYTGEYILKDWGQHTHTLGTWTTFGASTSIHLNTNLDDKVYFAGETYKLQHPLYLRGSVQAAILSGYDVVDKIKE